MKHLFLVFLLPLCSLSAMAQERSYGMSSTNASEIRADLLITKIREYMTISDKQALQLKNATSEYWDELQNIQGQKKYDDKFARLVARRDKEYQEILQDADLYLEFQKRFAEVLASQRKGYGRR